MRILVVDGANVVGCVPDGWWRDRAGAAARLHAALLRTPLPYDEVVLVLEGRAKAGVPAGQPPDRPAGGGTTAQVTADLEPPADAETGGVATCVTVVHAPGEGDDELVRQCHRCAVQGDETWLATADAGLLRRVQGEIAGAVGPRELRRGLARG